MNIFIDTIPHKSQRYPTVGDWEIEEAPDGTPNTINIHVSEEVGDWRAQALIAVHEAVEVLMCIRDGVTQKAVDMFDVEFEKEREAGNHSAEAEPGDDSKAPYYKQHQIATGFERILAAELGVDWNGYNDKVVSL